MAARKIVRVSARGARRAGQGGDSRRHKKIAFDEFRWGIVKRRLLEGQDETASDWVTGHPILFPNMLSVGSGGGDWTQYTFQIRVPRDDVSTNHFWFHAFVPPAGADVPRRLLDRVPIYDVPIKDANGQYLLEYVHAQDIMAWETQGPIADRSLEGIGTTDIGLVTFRKMLQRELKNVEEGRDPTMATIRNPRARAHRSAARNPQGALRRRVRVAAQAAHVELLADHPDLIDIFTRERNKVVA